ncbi:baseplate assembly protein [Lysinibacillus sp. NPDC047702]|uniref:baseplate assembly protein n=1 Tax=unclassified Lysinibacillus TaxID=2636778 RepID=UPI003D025305
MTQVVLPEINFLTTDAQELVNEIITLYEQEEGRKLSQADPLRLIFLSLASVITKQNVAINDAAKQNLLYYARDKVLDHKGAEMTTPRLEATAATTTLRLHLSVPLTSSRIIERGALATSNEGAIFFATVEETAISPGVDYVDVELECTTKGEIGNGFTIGQINTLVKPLPYVSHVENISVSEGGAEREADEPYRERIYLAPESLTNAGSEGAYMYFAKSASALISDVYVYMPMPGYVDIKILLKDGQLPSDEMIDKVLKAVSGKTVRPLTDNVSAGAPTVISFDLDMTYFIETNAVDKTLVHQKIQTAVAEWLVWQQSKIGRDINPSKLISLCIKAGAKRVDIRNPAFTVVEQGEVAQLDMSNVHFGGVEDD